MSSDTIDFEYFFSTAFENGGFENNALHMEGQSFDEVMKQINYAENWVFTLLQALKAWEAAMREKSKLEKDEVIMYGTTITEGNLFLYIYSVAPGPNGAPVIKKQLGRFAFKEYMNKLRETVEYMKPYLQAADHTMKLLK